MGGKVRSRWLFVSPWHLDFLGRAGQLIAANCSAVETGREVLPTPLDRVKTTVSGSIPPQAITSFFQTISRQLTHQEEVFPAPAPQLG
jgi:hypothetical protein